MKVASSIEYRVGEPMPGTKWVVRGPKNKQRGTRNASVKMIRLNPRSRTFSVTCLCVRCHSTWVDGLPHRYARPAAKRRGANAFFVPTGSGSHGLLRVERAAASRRRK
jgi:hypothetical protein